MEQGAFDFKIIFWVLAIGFYLYTQIKDAIKKGNKTDPIPGGPAIPQMPAAKPKPSPVTTSNTDPYKRPSYKASVPQKRYQSAYNKEEEVKRKNIEIEDYNKEIIAREAFYKETHKQEKPVNYEEQTIDRSGSVFGIDEHLQHYSIKKKVKHPLLQFLSDKNNLKNAFITGEILKRRD